MKRGFALLMALMLMLGFMGMAAPAEEAQAAVTELNWSDVEDAVAQSGIAGDFVSIDEVSMRMWLPEVLQPVELTDEHREGGFIAYYATAEGAEQSAVLSVVYVDMGGMEFAEYAEKLAEIEDVSQIEMMRVNGFPCVSYRMEKQDTVTLAFATEAGYVLEVTCMPTSGEEAATMLKYILSSIMKSE